MKIINLFALFLFSLPFQKSFADSKEPILTSSFIEADGSTIVSGVISITSATLLSEIPSDFAQYVKQSAKTIGFKDDYGIINKASEIHLWIVNLDLKNEIKLSIQADQFEDLEAVFCLNDVLQDFAFTVPANSVREFSYYVSSDTKDYSPRMLSASMSDIGILGFRAIGTLPLYGPKDWNAWSKKKLDRILSRTELPLEVQEEIKTSLDLND